MQLRKKKQKRSPDQTEKKFDWNLLKRFIAYLAPHKAKLMLMYLATIVQVGTTILIPVIMQISIDVHISAKNLNGLLIMCGFLAAALAGMFVSARIQGKLLTGIGYDVLFSLRHDLFSHLQKLSFRYFDGQKTGRIMTRITSDVQILEEMLRGGLTTLFVDILMLAGIILMMLFLDLRLSLVLLVTIPLFSILVFYVRKRLMVVARAIQKRLGSVNAFLNESISGIKVIRSFAREDINAGNFRKRNGEYYDEAKKFYPLNAFFWQSVTTIATIGISLVLLGGGILLSKQLITIGVIAAFLSYINRFFHPMQRLSNLLNQMSRSMASCERIFEILDEKPDIEDSESVLKDPEIKNGEVIFENLHFSYNENEPVLKGINLKVPEGKTAAIVGSTGAGKTTMINLLSRFYDPVKGRILIDGIDLKKYPQKKYRRQIATVMQDAIIFSGSILDNIRYAKPEADIEEVKKVAARMGIDEMFSSMPDGYNTEVGERGSNLSLGQKQLIAFARALLRDPKIMILDEASSYIDTYTEKLVQQAMNYLRRDRTTFIIAHRLSTIREADFIIVINEGRIMESGTHAELLAGNGYYAKLLKSQYSPGAE